MGKIIYKLINYVLARHHTHTRIYSTYLHSLSKTFRDLMVSTGNVHFAGKINETFDMALETLTLMTNGEQGKR